MAENENGALVVSGTPSFLDMRAFEDMKKYADYLKESKALPKGIENAGQLVMILQAGKDMGLTATEALSGICLVNGRPSIWGAVAASLITRAGYVIRWIDCSSVVAKLEIWHKDTPDQKHVEEFKIEEAAKAGLTGGIVWSKYPKVMLRWKALARARNFFCPHVAGGMPVKEDWDETDNTQQIPDVAKVEQQATEILEENKKKRKAQKAEEKPAVKEPEEAKVVEIIDVKPEIYASKESVEALAKLAGGEVHLKKWVSRAYNHNNIFVLTVEQVEDLRKQLEDAQKPRNPVQTVAPVDETVKNIAKKEIAEKMKASPEQIQKLLNLWRKSDLPEVYLANRTDNILEQFIFANIERAGASLANLTPTEVERMISLVIERNNKISEA